MKELKEFEAKLTTPEDFMVVLPLSILNSMNQKQDEIISHLKLESKQVPVLKEYISEPEARKLLNRKVTWFWQMRKEGKLTAKKIGGTSYYKITEIEELLNKKG